MEKDTIEKLAKEYDFKVDKKEDGLVFIECKEVGPIMTKKLKKIGYDFVSCNWVQEENTMVALFREEK